MPYSITTRDGITINGIPDDVPADSPELRARVAKIRGTSPLDSPTVNAGPRILPPEDRVKTDDPGAVGAFDIEAGRTFDKLRDGLVQLLLQTQGGQEGALAALKTDNDRKESELAPLREMHPIATAFGGVAPAAAISGGGGASLPAAAARLFAAGAAPAAMEYGSAGERLTNAAQAGGANVLGGVLAPKVLGGVASAVPGIGRTGRALVEPLYQGGRQAIVGRTLNRAAGDKAPGLIQRIVGAAQEVPGSAPTVGQVAENGGLAALERSVASQQPAEFTARRMQQSNARSGALRGIAGDDARMTAAENAREASTKQLYATSDAKQVAIDPTLSALLARPSMVKALERAARLAEESGRPLGVDVANGTISGRGLQDLKMSLDALLNPQSGSGIVGAEARALEGTRGQLMNWAQNQIPEFRLANDTYRTASKPINQMEVGRELQKKIGPALNDYGQLGRETGSQYANALRDADAFAAKATGRDGARMADIMDPAQMATLEGIARDLARKANADDLGRGAGSNTFQNLSMGNIASQAGAPSMLPRVPALSKIADVLYRGPEEEIQDLLAQSLLDPQLAGGLMGRFPARPAPLPLAQRLLANPSRIAQVLGGAGGMTLGNPTTP